MQQFLTFIRTKTAGGFLVVLSVALVIMLIVETIDLIDDLTDPLASLFGFEEIAGIGVGTLLAVGTFLLLCFAAGVLLSTRVGASIETNLLERLPGYRLIKSLTHSFATADGESRFALAAVNLYGDGTRVLGFIVDEVEGGDFSIFVPNAPAPATGNVYFVPRDRVERLAAPLSSGVNSLMQWGIHSAELLPRP